MSNFRVTLLMNHVWKGGNESRTLSLWGSQLAEKYTQDLDWGKQMDCLCQKRSWRVHCKEGKRPCEPCRQEGEPWRARLFTQNLFLPSDRAHLMASIQGEGWALAKIPVLWTRTNAGKECCPMTVLASVSMRCYLFSIE